MRSLDRYTRVVVSFCPSTSSNIKSSPLAPRTQRARRTPAKLRALKGIPLALIALLAAAPNVAAATSATTTLLSATPASSVSSSVITMTANVSSGGVAATGGTVTFVDTFNGISETLGTIQVQSANGTAGTAILRTEIGGVGQHALVATYNGTKLLAKSSSPAQTVTFTPFYGSASSLASTGSSGAYGLTATVSAFGPTAPTGQVAFTNTTVNTTLGTATLDASTLQVGFTPVRKYPIANLLSPSPSGAAAPAIGDFNGDGRPDFVVPTSGGPIVILLGNGDGTFTAGTSLTGGSPSSAVVTDFNGDGNQDIAVLDTAGTGKVTVFLGNGDGTFQAGKSFNVATTTSDSRILAVGDFNGDGIPDMVASDHALNKVAVLLGNGDGTFQPASYYDTGAQPWNIVVGDINNDGIQDLAVADDLDTNVTILLGNGDGTFRRGASPSVLPGSQSGSVALGDFNGDGNLDLAVTDQGQNHIYVFLGKGDGTFKTPVTYTMAGGPYYLTIADFNRDGKLDIISSNNAGATVGIMLGKGDGTFSAPTYYPVGGKSIFATVGDLNGDDQVDVAAITASGLSILLAGQAESASLSGIDVHGCGAQAVTGTYSGDTTYSASTSAAVSLTPTTLATTITALATPSASTYGQQVVLTATLVPSNYGSTLTDGETVTFKNGTSVVGTAPLVSGVATLNLTTLALGSNSLTASYPGDCTFQASTSPAVTEVVTQGTATITWANPAAVPYGTALSATQLNATANLPGTFVYTPAAGTVLIAGTHTLSVKFTPTDTVHYLSSTASVSLVVNPVAATLTWANPAAISYGTALSATQLNATANVPGSFVYTPAAGTVLTAGTHTLSVTFTPTDAVDYLPASANVTLVVNQGAPVVTWANPAAITYGTPLSATQLNATANVAGTFAYAPVAGTVLPAGTHTLSVTFTPTDAVNYSTASATVTLLVNHAATTLTWGNPAPITYGTALSAAQLNATANVPGTFAYTPVAGTVLAAGTHTLSVTFTPTDAVDYLPASANVTLVVNKVAPVVTWANPAAITYGTPLSATQLNATASIPGTFAYAPGAGTVLAAGTHTLSVTFTPTDAVDYLPASATVTLVVNQAASLVSWANPAAITYGTALSATQLNATANVPGTFAYTPGAGIVLAAGTHTLSVTFTPTDAVNYSAASATVTLLVNQAATTLNWGNPAPITYGTALSPTQLNATANVPGAFVYTPSAGTVLGVGPHTLSVRFTPTDSVDYPAATATVTLVVNVATLNVTANDAARAFNTANPVFIGTVTGAVNGDVFVESFTSTATIASPVGTYPIVPAVSGTSLSNYNVVISNGTLTITKAVATLTWANPAPIAYGTALSATQLNATASVAGTFAYTPAAGTVLATGTHTLSVTFTPTDATDYAGASATVTLLVNQGTATLTWANPAPITYGTALSATQLNATATVPGSFAYTPAAGTVLAAGTHTLSVTFTPTDSVNYSTATATVTLLVNRATPTLTWANPAAIAAGIPLSSTQLNATASVAGSFVYTPSAGTVLPAGTHSLSVTFTPTDTTDYSNASATVTLLVNQGVATLTWANPAAITYGTPLSSTQLNATASVPGSFAYTPAAGAVLTAGSHTLSVTFTPTDTVNYQSATATVTLVVNQATPLLTWSNPASITFGTALSATQLNATASVPGTFLYAPAAGSVPPTGTHTLSVTFTPTDSVNYRDATASVTLIVSQGSTTTTLSWADPAPITYGTALSATQLNATANVPGTFVYTPTAGTVLAAGLHSLSVTFTPTDTTNHSVASASVSILVTAATLHVSAENASRLFGAANPLFTGTVTGAINGDTFTETFSTVATISSPAGTYPIIPTVSGPNLANYTLVTSNGTLTIGIATLTIDADNATRTYGAANPTFTGHVTGAINGDTFTETFTTTAIPTSPAGSYSIVPSVSGANLSSYVVVVKNGTLTVNKSVLTVTAQDASRAAGLPNPVFTAAITGFLGADTASNSTAGQPALTTIATTSSAAGTYPITASIGTLASGNYSFTLVPGTLTITGGSNSLTVQVSDASRPFGAANPAFASVITGAQNGDTFTVAYTTTATAISDPGTFPITATVSGTNLANYSLTVVPGTLTVTKASTVTTVASSASDVSANTPVTLSAIVTSATTGTPGGTVIFSDGSQQVGTGALVNGAASFTTGPLAVGTHSFTAAFGGATDYLGSSSGVSVNATTLPFVITVTPNPIVVAWRHTAHMTVTVTPAPGFTGTVNLACSGIHNYDSVCNLGIASLSFASATGAAQTTAMDVTTSFAPLGAVRESEIYQHGSPILPALSFWIPGLLLGGLGAGQRKRLNRTQKRVLLVMALALGAVTMSGLTGCGSGKPSEGGSYTVALQGQGANGTQYSQAVTVVINIQNP